MFEMMGTAFKDKGGEFGVNKSINDPSDIFEFFTEIITTTITS